MVLYINTSKHDKIIINLQDKNKIVTQRKIVAPRRQAEELLKNIDSLLKENNLELDSLDKIIVTNKGGSFTSLRIGVVTANALAFALQIPVEAEGHNDSENKKFAQYSIVEPLYDREPQIGVSKKRKL